MTFTFWLCCFIEFEEEDDDEEEEDDDDVTDFGLISIVFVSSTNPDESSTALSQTQLMQCLVGSVGQSSLFCWRFGAGPFWKSRAGGSSPR